MAVMGFKCRVIQLQGELDRARSEMGGSSMAEVITKYSDLIPQLTIRTYM